MNPSRPDPARTPPDGREPTDPARAGAWLEDSRQIDRYLDGEGDAAERTARDADLAARPDAARALAGRRVFLEALRSARWAPGGVEASALRALERRVRAALQEDRDQGVAASERLPAETPLAGLPYGTGRARLGRARPFVVGAAALLAGVGAWLLHGGERTAVALDPYVTMAADVLGAKPDAFETCAQGRSADVNSLSLVREGELQVTGCATKPAGDGASVAVLRRPEELPVVGYVAVPDSGTTEAGVVGITEVEGRRVVVFDVLDHGRRVYLAVNADVLRAKRDAGDDRWTCTACHGPERRAMPNPHKIVLRRSP